MRESTPSFQLTIFEQFATSLLPPPLTHHGYTMNQKKRTWETSIWLGINRGQSQEFYGGSLNELRRAVYDWLVEMSPADFGNSCLQNEITKQRTYSQATPKQPLSVSGEWQKSEVTSGWVCTIGDPDKWGRNTHFERIEDAAMDFVKNSILFRKGADWKKLPLEGNVFPLHEIKSFARTESTDQANDYAQNGWYLLSVEVLCTPIERDATEKRSSFVFGHPEANAADLIL